MDTLQTQKSFYYSFRIQSQDTVRICSKHGSHYVTHSDFNNQIQTRYAPDTATILFLIQIQLSAPGSDALQTWKSFCHLSGSQLQIHSRHGSHSATHTDLNFKYSPDTHQTQLPFCHSFRIYP